MVISVTELQFIESIHFIRSYCKTKFYSHSAAYYVVSEKNV